MATPLVVGAAVGSAALGARYLVRAWAGLRANRGFYRGGFQQVMNRREAALILGVREQAAVEKIKEAHRRVMVANHPDSGGSTYLATKINQAKDILLNKYKASPHSAF